tara:strand:+ start:1795 stop:2433 length:639 start_codon:yes stop_codon:yes gene_type:complete
LEERVAHHTDWILVALLVASFLVVFARLYHPKKFYFFRALPFNRGAKTFESEFNPNGVRDAFDVLLTLNFYLVYTMGCLLILPEAIELYSFARVLFIILLFFLTKNFLALFVGWLFQEQERIAVVQNTNLAYRSWSALWLLPILIITTFTPGLRESGSYLILFFMLAGYLLALLISSLRLWDLPGGTNYKILYLCALEIVPFSFLIYWLKSL